MAARHLFIAAAVSLRLTCASEDAAAQANEQPAITADQALQSQIRAAVRTCMAGKKATDEEASSVFRLTIVARRDADRLSAQIFAMYCDGADSRDETERLRLFLIVVLGVVDVPPASIVKTVVPYMDSNDEVLRDTARRFLELVEGPSRVGINDFSHYESFLVVNKKSPPPSLVRYMYDRAPDTAVAVMLRVYGSRQEPFRDVLWAEHVVSDNLWKQQKHFLDEEEVLPEALAEVAKMAAHKEWWARLYAAEIVAQHPEFGTPEMIEAFKNDEHELVREATIPEEKPKPRVAPPDDDGGVPAREDDAAPRNAAAKEDDQ